MDKIKKNVVINVVLFVVSVIAAVCSAYIFMFEWAVYGGGISEGFFVSLKEILFDYLKIGFWFLISLVLYLVSLFRVRSLIKYSDYETKVKRHYNILLNVLFTIILCVFIVYLIITLRTIFVLSGIII